MLNFNMLNLKINWRLYIQRLLLWHLQQNLGYLKFITFEIGWGEEGVGDAAGLEYIENLLK